MDIYWPIYQSWIIYADDCEAISEMHEWQGKPKYWKKTCLSAALSTTDPTLLDPGSNPGRRDWNPATNRLN
jgi:hypothetical protein